MARYIDADKLIAERTIFMQDEEAFDVSVVLVSDIKLAPTADVEEVKRGEWLWDTEDKYKCSCCHYETRVDEVMGLPRYKYCPNCGAKMNVNGD